MKIPSLNVFLRTGSGLVDQTGVGEFLKFEATVQSSMTAGTGFLVSSNQAGNSFSTQDVNNLASDGLTLQGDFEGTGEYAFIPSTNGFRLYSCHTSCETCSGSEANECLTCKATHPHKLTDGTCTTSCENTAYLSATGDCIFCPANSNTVLGTDTIEYLTSCQSPAPVVDSIL